MTKARKQAQQKPPPGIVWIEDYRDRETSEVLLGIASRLGVTPGTYRKWRMANKGPRSFHLGRLVAARIADIDAYIAGLERQADEAAALTTGDARPPEPRQPITKRLAKVA